MKKFLTITISVFLGLAVLINSAIFNFVPADPALIAGTFISWIVVAMLSFVIASHYTIFYKNKANFGNSRKMGDYHKNIITPIIFMALFSVGISIIGGVISYSIGTIIQAVKRDGVDDVIFNSAIVTVPTFIIYMAGIYKNFVKWGFLDCSKGVFNLHFKVLTLLLALMFFMPSAIAGNAYGAYTQSGIFLNFRTIFSFNKIDLLGDSYIIDSTLNVNILLVTLKTLSALTTEIAVAAFAYIRGKRLFIKRYMKIDRDYQTDEIMQAQAVKG